VKPKSSLPRYDEPTPEAGGTLSREQEAELALSHTLYTPGSRTIIVVLFLATIAIVPLIELVAQRNARGDVATLISRLTASFPSWEQIRAARNWADFENLVPRGADLKETQREIERGSVVSQSLRPHVQNVLTENFGAGNDQVFVGLESWLFYRADVDYITGPPFLDSNQMKRRARTGIEPDPINAIVEFRDELAARGIDLIVLPIPVKPGVQAERLTDAVPKNAMLHNTSFAQFKSLLEKKGVRVFDASFILAQGKDSFSNTPVYLTGDTHWRPETMEMVAAALAHFIGIKPSSSRTELQIVEKKISGVGDTVNLLGLSPSEALNRAEEVRIHQVMTEADGWAPDKNGDALLLGDSFAAVFSSDALGWGESAGLAEHLSRALGGRPLDCIVRNSDAAFAPRELLQRELGRDPARLAGKRLVIWEFAERELAFGNWKHIKLNQSPAKQP
jgi:alginate O-acetyltransferase complex protein AlgJ